MEVFNLNIRPGKTCPVIHCSQFDKGRTFRANLYDGSEVFTLTAAETLSVIEKKSDGNMVTIGVTNTSDSYVEFATTEQMTALAGPQICELRIVEGDTLIGSANFILDCEESPDTGIESESEIHNLETQIQDINEQIVPDMVAEEVSNQYDSQNVIFDDHPTEGHGTGYVVKSENVPDELNDLDDVNIDDTSLERGQALVYNPETGKWENDTIPQTGTIEDVAVASFSDGADDVPLSMLIFDINPVQDLHGYDKPWVGGAGKNLYVGSPSFDGYGNLSNWTKQNETYNGHEVYKNNGDWQGLYKSFPLKAGTYTFSVMMKSDESNTTANLYNDKGTGAQLASFSVGTAWQRCSAQFTISADTNSSSIRIETTDGRTIYISEYQLELGSTATSYEPYSNICPITGHDSGLIRVDGDQVSNIYTVDFGQTVYGGTLNVTTGLLTITHGYIASYNGETINDPWISSIDEYAPNTSPSTGAEVVYPLSTPTTVQLTPTEVRTLLNNNNIFVDTGNINRLVYFKTGCENIAKLIEAAPNLASVQSVNGRTGAVELDADNIPYDSENSIAEKIDENTQAIGDISDLDTTDKSSLVGSVNEVVSNKANSSDVYTKTQIDLISNATIAPTAGNGNVYYKTIGNLVIVFGLINTTSGMSTGQDVITGLPRNMNGANNVIKAINNDGTSADWVLYQTNGGTSMKTSIVHTGAKSYTISFAYYTA